MQTGKEQIKNFLLVTVGTILLAIGVYFFKFPNNFSTGGVSGISILLGKLIPYVSTAAIMWTINLALLVVGFIVFGRGFGLMTAYSSTLYSGLTWIFETVYPMTEPFTDEPFLELCFAMMIPAVASAILFLFQNYFPCLIQPEFLLSLGSQSAQNPAYL